MHSSPGYNKPRNGSRTFVREDDNGGWSRSCTGRRYGTTSSVTNENHVCLLLLFQMVDPGEWISWTMLPWLLFLPTGVPPAAVVTHPVPVDPPPPYYSSGPPAVYPTDQVYPSYPSPQVYPPPVYNYTPGNVPCGPQPVHATVVREVVTVDSGHHHRHHVSRLAYSLLLPVLGLNWQHSLRLILGAWPTAQRHSVQNHSPSSRASPLSSRMPS